MQTPSSRRIRQHELRFTSPSGERAARAYRPDTDETMLPMVLYFHGGGFVGGSLDDAITPASTIALHAQAVVLTVEYALAPALPFPAAPEDAYAALLWAVKHAAKLGADDASLAVAGDDAGGNLAAALTLISRDRNGPAIAAQALIAPMLDPSMTRLGDCVRLQSDIDAETCAARYRQYLPEPRQRIHPYASPLVSTRQAGLPPALILTAGCDVLHREAETYAEALISSGVPTQVVRYPKVTHAMLAQHQPALDEAAHFLRRRLHEMPARHQVLNL